MHRSYEKNLTTVITQRSHCRNEMSAVIKESIRINLMKWCQKFDGFRIETGIFEQ